MTFFNRALSFGVILTIAFALIGCATAGQNFDLEKTKEVEKGMTKAKVREIIGQEPSQTQKSSQGTTWIYQYTRAQSSPLSYVPIVGPVIGGTNTTQKMFQVHFDNSGKVTRWNRSSR